VNCGDIILLIHFATDIHCTKIRPALVVSSDNYNARETDRILLPISSNIARACPDDILIKDNENAFKATGLKISSAIRVGKIFTADVSLIKRRIGHLPDKTMDAVRNQIKQVLGLR